jgi:hypothetical protein
MNDLVDFISEDLKNYMKQEHLEFTDSEMATLIFNSALPEHEISSRLEAIAGRTEDEKLKAQIRERLRINQEDMEAYLNNTDGYVYAVESYEYIDPYICGYFVNHKLAYEYGLKQGCRFEIQKLQIIGGSENSGQDTHIPDTLEETTPVKSRIYTNPYITEDRNIKDCITEYESYEQPVAAADYDENGTLISLRSIEIKREDKSELERIFSSQRFENAFLYIKHPFERGDIVRMVNGSNVHGIVATSQKEWKQYLEEVRGGKFKGSDYIDSTITVDFIDNDTHSIYHNHINPAFLEMHQPDKQDEDYHILCAGSYLLKGESDLDYFLSVYKEYENKKSETEDAH